MCMSCTAVSSGYHTDGAAAHLLSALPRLLRCASMLSAKSTRLLGPTPSLGEQMLCELQRSHDTAMQCAAASEDIARYC